MNWGLNDPGASDHVTIPWSNPSGNNVWFEMLIENPSEVPGGQSHSLTTIHGYVADYPPDVWAGCVYYVQADTSDVGSPVSYSPWTEA